MQALRRADAAGDAVAAQAIARRIQQIRSDGSASAVDSPRVMNRKLSPVEMTRRNALAPSDPTAGESAFTNFAAGAGRSIYETGRGLGQLVGAVSDEDVEEARQLDAPLMQSNAGGMGNLGGLAAQLIGPGAVAKGVQGVATGAGMLRTAKVAGAAGRALLPTGALGNIAQGAALGAIQPTTRKESRAGNAALGAVGGGLGYMVPGVARGVRATLIDPLTDAGNDRIIGNTLRRFANNPDAIGRAPQSSVPGLRYTLAEATQDPGIAALERAAMSDPKVASELALRQAANNRARVQALEGIAGQAGDIEAATQARAAATAPLYQSATSMPVLIDDGLKELMKRPSIQRGIARAQKFAQEQGTKLPKSPELMSGQHLQYIDQALSDMIGKASKSKSYQRMLKQTQSDLRGWMEAQMPDYLAAQQQFRALSRPIDQMKVGQRMLDQGAPGAFDPTDGTPILRSDAVLRMANDLDTTAARATGFRGARADNILSPQQRQTISGVADSLARKQQAQTLAKPVGSNTMQNLYSQNLMSQFGLPDAMSNLGPVGRLGGILDSGMKLAGVPERLQARLAEVLADPSKAQAILGRLPRKDREILQRAIASGVGRGVAVGQD